MKRLFQIFIIVFYLIFPNNILSQKINIHGKVLDYETKAPLPFANIRVNGKNIGTAANKEGEYRLNISPGDYTLIISYIGYISDTVNVELNKKKEINFTLKSGSVKIAEVTVSADNDFVASIIKQAIETKKRNRQKLKSYKFSAYTKGIIKTTRDFSNPEISGNKEDNNKLKINGIIENESRGFYKAPDMYKEIIVARKQTANAPPFINAMTAGTVIQSFYEEKLDFMGRFLPSPIFNRALKYYNYTLEKEFNSAKKKIYQIAFKTKNPSTIGFYGKIFIEDSTFALLKVDAFLNDAANPGGIFNFVNIFQQFSIFENNIILPVDYHLSAEGNYLGLAKFGFELHSVMYNYKINKPIDERIFDNAILTVLPNADSKDKSYWQTVKAIPSTMEEVKAYKTITKYIKTKKVSLTSLLLLPRLKLNDSFSITGPLAIYNFNKVEGSNLALGLYYNDIKQKRLNGGIKLSYGFADNKLKKEISAEYLLGNYRTTKISIKAFDKLTALFRSSDNYNQFTSTFLSLFTKYDFRNYYYTKGIDAEISADISPFINLGFGFKSLIDKTAKNNSDFSFFYKKKKYSTNTPIYNTKTNAVKTSITLDFRKYIEDGFFQQRITPQNFIMFEGEATFSNKSFLKSDTDFQLYKLLTYGRFITFKSASLIFAVTNVFSKGSVPLQMMYALSGNINAAGKNNSFRTLGVGEIFGDKITTIFLTHNFNDELFRMFGIPYLKRSHIQLQTYLNIAWSNISEESKNILPISYTTFKKPFYELGFSIGHILFPFTLEFTWKLNYRGHNNFVIGINTFVL